MFLIARTDRSTGAETDWLVAFSANADLIQVTTTRQKARRFKAAADAHAVRNRLESVEAIHNWKVVEA